jgi:hypothetical protein
MRVGVTKIRSLKGLVGGRTLGISQGKEGDAGAMTPAHGALPADEAESLQTPQGLVNLRDR